MSKTFSLYSTTIILCIIVLNTIKCNATNVFGTRSRPSCEITNTYYIAYTQTTKPTEHAIFNFVLNSIESGTFSHTHVTSNDDDKIFKAENSSDKTIVIILLSTTSIFLLLMLIRNILKMKKHKQIQIEKQTILESEMEQYAKMSHEIRSQLTLIITPTQKLLNIDDNAERNKYYQTINNNAQYLLERVNKLIDYQQTKDNDLSESRDIHDSNKDIIGNNVLDNEDTKTQQHGKYNIAIVEDDNNINKFISKELEALYNTNCYTDCTNAQDVIIQKLYNLVIIDAKTENMSGFSLCKKLKQNINTNHIPIIILLEQNKEKDIIECLNSGADAYLIKPFSIDILAQTIKTLIHNREQLKAKYSGNQDQSDKLQRLEEQTPDEKLMERVVAVVNKNIGNSEFGVETLAKSVGLSRTHLLRKLKEITGQTSYSFIRNIRMQQAAKLLAEKDYDINQVAEMVGFENYNYFSTAFKETFGIQPMQYRDEHCNAKKGIVSRRLKSKK